MLDDSSVIPKRPCISSPERLPFLKPLQYMPTHWANLIKASLCFHGDPTGNYTHNLACVPPLLWDTELI